MTDQKKAGRPGNSKTAKRTKNARQAQTGWGGPAREYAPYVFVWFAGLAVGAWLF